MGKNHHGTGGWRRMHLLEAVPSSVPVRRWISPSLLLYLEVFNYLLSSKSSTTPTLPARFCFQMKKPHAQPGLVMGSQLLSGKAQLSHRTQVKGSWEQRQRGGYPSPCRHHHGRAGWPSMPGAPGSFRATAFQQAVGCLRAGGCW